jgi:hypothetical protein
VAAEAKLAEIAVLRKEKELRLVHVETDLRKREQTRERMVRTAVENDPAYLGKEEGFLARLEALERISQQFHVKLVVILFHIGLFGIELAAVLAKVATFIPASYTRVLAFNDLKGSAWWAMRLKEEIDGMRKSHREGTRESPPPAQAFKSLQQPEQQDSEPLPAEADKVRLPLRRMFTQGQGKEEAEEPPHNDTAYRRVRPNGQAWRMTPDAINR